ncbi:MAG: PHB depolymerase family esterase [Candidatus Moranbacteria bacterium]|nr:PHB depolymerase family esterase [Candidatus Moranbacteria bacterium]
MKNKKIILVLIFAVLFAMVLIVVGMGKFSSMEPDRDLSGYDRRDFNFTLEHDGIERSYIVHIPAGYDRNSETPLVIALHGGGGDAANGPEYFGLNRTSDEKGFIVAYPEGSGKEVFGKTFATWNAGRCCGDALRENVDDVGFIAAMIGKMETDFNIDGRRIFATGMSNGAQMAYRLACELSGKIAAIAPSGSQGTFDDCRPERAVPVFHIQGKADPCSPYGGGTCGRCMADFWRKIGVPARYDDWQCVSIPDYVDKWRTMNGCSEKTNITFQNGGAVCSTYEGCQQNADVTLCAVDGLGHNWAGREDYGIQACGKDPNGKICQEWKNTVGPSSQDLLANEKIWEFFEKHPMVLK